MSADEDEEDLPIGRALRLLRGRAGFTQTDVARNGGPDFRTISHWETGRKYPSLRLLFRYLKALKMDLCDLQGALDQIENRPGLGARVTDVERRLSVLERAVEVDSDASGEDVLS